MASEKTDKMTGSRSLDTSDFGLADFSCPFNWKMEKIIGNPNQLSANTERRESIDDLQEYFPEYPLIYHLMLAYESTIKNELQEALQSINEAELVLAEIKQMGTLKNMKNALQHLFVSTKCHIIQKLGEVTQVHELLKEIIGLNDMNQLELAMLSGCECTAWSLYRTADNKAAIKSAQRAIEYEPDNGKWHFLLGKSYRRLRRRDVSIAESPTKPEALAFEKAYSLSRTVLFGVSLAQMYRESRSYPMAEKIYKDVYELNPTCHKVRLQLALGFIRTREPSLAKACLDYVAKEMQGSSTYEHYMGIYEEKCNRNLQTALEHYKNSIEKLNYAAEWQYIECRKQVEDDWDPLPYLIALLDKYANETPKCIQEINAYIGLYYIFDVRNILSACSYLIKAITIQPSCKQLKSHSVLFHKIRVNTYEVLSKEVKFALQSGKSIYENDEIAILMDAQSCIIRNNTALNRNTVRSGVNTTSNSYQSNRQSWRTQTVERSSPSSFQRLPSNRPPRDSAYSQNSQKGSSGVFYHTPVLPLVSSRGRTCGSNGRYSRATLKTEPQLPSTRPKIRESSFGQIKQKNPSSNIKSQILSEAAASSLLPLRSAPQMMWTNDKQMFSTKFRNGRHSPLSKHQDKNDFGEGAASCSLVKVMKNLNL